MGCCSPEWAPWRRRRSQASFSRARARVSPSGHSLRWARFASGLGQIEFGGWDIFPEDAYEAAEHAKVLEAHHLAAVKDELHAIRPMKGVFYPGYVKRLHGTHTKSAASKAEMVEQVREDIVTFKRDRGCDRLVAVWCGSTEAFIEASAVHESVAAFE